MAIGLMPKVKQNFLDNDGNPLTGGLLYSYIAGTTTPVDTYSDSTGMTTNTNPIVLDARGEADVWLSSAFSYKFTLRFPDQTEIWTVDDVSITAGGGSGGGADELVKINGGDLLSQYLQDKMTPGDGIILNVVDTGSNILALEVSVDTDYFDGKYVTLDTDQTITGDKTFTKLDFVDSGAANFNLYGNTTNNIPSIEVGDFQQGHVKNSRITWNDDGTGGGTGIVLQAGQDRDNVSNGAVIEINDNNVIIEPTEGDGSTRVSIDGAGFDARFGSSRLRLLPNGYWLLDADLNFPANDPTNLLAVNSSGILMDGSSLITDELVKISASDTTPGYVDSKFNAGTNISFNILNPGGDEVLEVNASSTTAGIINRVYLTADIETVNAVNYYGLSDTGKGSTPSASQTVNNNDNEKTFFGQDWISGEYGIDTHIFAGDYSGQITVEIDSNAGNQRFTLEVYLTDSLGVPKNAGGAIGDLGVETIGILDTGIIDILSNNPTQVALTANVANDVPVLSTDRIRIHASAEKVGTAGGDVNMTLFSGSDYESYFNVPVNITSDAVTDVSTVNPGGTQSQTNEILNLKLDDVDAGANIIIDKTNPQNPIISATGGITIPSSAIDGAFVIKNTDDSYNVTDGVQTAPFYWNAIEGKFEFDNAIVDLLGQFKLRGGSAFNIEDGSNIIGNIVENSGGLWINHNGGSGELLLSSNNGDVSISAISGQTNLLGDTYTTSGTLSVSPPVLDEHAATKKYVDDNIGGSQDLQSVLDVGNVADKGATFGGNVIVDNGSISLDSNQIILDNFGNPHGRITSIFGAYLDVTATGTGIDLRLESQDGDVNITASGTTNIDGATIGGDLNVTGDVILDSIPTGTQVGVVGYDANGKLIQGSGSGSSAEAFTVDFVHAGATSASIVMDTHSAFGINSVWYVPNDGATYTLKSMVLTNGRTIANQSSTVDIRAYMFNGTGNQRAVGNGSLLYDWEAINTVGPQASQFYTRSNSVHNIDIAMTPGQFLSLDLIPLFYTMEDTAVTVTIERTP